MQVRISTALLMVCAALCGVILTYTLLHPGLQRADAAAELSFQSDDEARTIEVYRATNEAVVFISTIVLRVDPFDLFLEAQPREGTGSGMIVDAEKGIILTNLHVIQDADRIQIILANGRGYTARLLGYDREYDIAVLQLHNPPPNLKAFRFGDSSKLQVGQRVLAIGNPFGLNRSLTTGIVSSLERTVKGPSGNVMRSLIQTDAAINPGNSGGPLLDMDGRVVGINTAILSSSGDSAGIGFAVPMNQIRRVLPELIATGKILRPKMGWILIDTDQGPMVRRVLAVGPAEQAGIEPLERMVDSVFMRGFVTDPDRADVITSVNGKRVTSREEVEGLIEQAEVGKPLIVTARRGGLRGRERQLTITPVLR